MKKRAAKAARQEQDSASGGTNDNQTHLRRGFSWRGLKFSHAKDPPSYTIFEKQQLRLPDRERVAAFFLSNVSYGKVDKRRSCWTFGTVCDNYMIMITILI